MLLFSCSKKLPSAKIFRCYLAVPASWAPHSDSCVANGSKAQHNQLSDQRLGEGRAKSMMEIGAARMAYWRLEVLITIAPQKKRFKKLKGIRGC